MSSSRFERLPLWRLGLAKLGLAVAVAAAIFTPTAAVNAQATPGYPEQVVQWTVQAGETCADVASAMYGNRARTDLVLRYNRVGCTAGAPLATGKTLVLPAAITDMPSARITSVNPETRARPAGGAWSPAAPGQPLSASSAVNTLEEGRAGIRFIDRSRVYLAANTLVVIYGTAAQSQVSRVRPARVKLDRGELQAGLAALRGGSADTAEPEDTVEVDVEGGGRVSATSRDTVLRRQATRTNVSVFDGTASVASAGASVDVPTNFGTRFVDATPPEPPRPLPPAPVWQGAPPIVALAFGGEGIVQAAWEPIPKAQLYRLELARDASFEDLVVREQVPADVTAFRAEKLPPGRYHMRVRGIDTDDFLGIASEARVIDVVSASWQRGEGSVAADRLAPSRYAILALDAAADLQAAIDDGPFGPVPATIDFAQLSLERLRLRRQPASEDQSVERALTIDYLEPTATITLDETETDVSLTVSFAGLDRLDIVKDVAPYLRVTHADGVTNLPLERREDGTFFARAALRDATRVDAVDGQGRVIGTLIPGVEVAPPVAQPTETLPFPRIGPTVPWWALSPRLATVWSAPTTPSMAAASALVASDGDPVSLRWSALGGGSIGPLGIDASVHARPPSDGRAAETSAWLGLRYRAYRLGRSEVELAPAVRVGFPLDPGSPPPRIEPSLALGGADDDLSWLVNLGGRVRLGEVRAQQTFVDAGQVHLLAGGTYEVVSWLRLLAVVDAQLLIPGDDQAVLFRGGLAGGIEAGETFFISLLGRASPWNDVGGYGAGQLALGVREWSTDD